MSVQASVPPDLLRKARTVRLAERPAAVRELLALVGLSETIRLLGVSKQRVYQITGRQPRKPGMGWGRAAAIIGVTARNARRFAASAGLNPKAVRVPASWLPIIRRQLSERKRQPCRRCGKPVGDVRRIYCTRACWRQSQGWSPKSVDPNGWLAGIDLTGIPADGPWGTNSAVIRASGLTCMQIRWLNCHGILPARDTGRKWNVDGKTPVMEYRLDVAARCGEAFRRWKEERAGATVPADD